ncbi:uncharacterized protein LOC141533439 [Cotesia typhae]|uniref:uncharacterized protein LOC141533439 n=1 Tax=Cotesia typhae TaxID=2053667 RepID=UPI003D6979A0
MDQQTSVQVKRSVQANIVLLCWYAHQFTRLSGQVVGGDLSARNSLIKWQDLENAFSNNIKSGCVVNHAHTDLREFLNDSKDLVIEKIGSMMRNAGNLKVNVELFFIFRNSKNGDTVEEKKSFNTKSREIIKATRLDEWYMDNVYHKLLKKVEEFNQKDSGWSLVEINNLVVTMSTFLPLQAGESTYMQLPKDIQYKRAVLNIKNFDEYCFLWCIVAALYEPQTGHPERTTSYPHFSSVLNYEGIKIPVALRDIPKFEKLNNLSINVYGIESEFTQKKSEKSKIIPVYLSNYFYYKKVIHLLIIEKNMNTYDNDTKN